MLVKGSRNFLVPTKQTVHTKFKDFAEWEIKISVNMPRKYILRHDAIIFAPK